MLAQRCTWVTHGLQGSAGPAQGIHGLNVLGLVLPRAVVLILDILKRVTWYLTA